MRIKDKIAVVTGAGSGIGLAVCMELARRGARRIAMVDRSEHVRDVAAQIDEVMGFKGALPLIGDVCDDAFRKRVFDQLSEDDGVVSILVPAAGITRDALAVRLDKTTGQPLIYPVEHFRQVCEVNLVSPVYWAIELVARMAAWRYQRGLKRWLSGEDVQGTIIFIGSVSRQGNKGQIAYAATKAGLEGAAATLMKEAMFYGVRTGVIHPGFTNTPMVHALSDDYIQHNVLPYTQLQRLIEPDEIADAICFMIANSAVSGELWADAGWHPAA
jgi:3-oxoacyl-[acyl-carrier protein] reductase